MIFISTSCLKGKRPLKEILKEYVENGITNIELGASHSYEEGIVDFIKKIKLDYSCIFTIHAYFPPEKDQFFVNLASQDKTILKRSIDHIKNMITAGKEIGAVVCSFHSGFRFDSKEIKDLSDVKIHPYKEAYETLLSSVIEIALFAKEVGMKIAIEPNELSRKHLRNGKNECLLMVEPKELETFFYDLEKSKINNVFILLDLGHLRLSSNSLSYNAEYFIEKIIDKTVEIHLHDNDGVEDKHNILKKGSWVFENFKKHAWKKGCIITLESNGLEINDIKDQVELISGVKSG